MFRNQRARRGGIGLLLLANSLHKVGLGNVGPVTLATIVGQSLLYMGIINPPWNAYDVCLSAEAILYRGSYRRLILACIEHADDIHLYFNMVSLLYKGRTLESMFGSVKFFVLLVIFTVVKSWTYVGLAVAAKEYYESYSYMQECAVGFSGVLFALKVLTTHYERSNFSQVLWFTVPSKYAVWAELLIIHILVPNSSFMGHLAGILVGLAYIYGPLSIIVDEVSNVVNILVSNRRPSTYYYSRAYSRRSYTYAHGTTRGETYTSE